MPDYAIIGRLTIDCFLTADERVHEGILGGGAAYAAIGARHWTPSVALCARIGAGFPQGALEQLQAHEFDLSHLQRAGRPLNQQTFFAYQEPLTRLNGKPTRHFLRVGKQLPKTLLEYASRPETRSRDALDPEPDQLRLENGDCEAAHLAPLSWSKTNLLAARLRERGIPLITLDPNTTYLKPGTSDQIHILLHEVDAFLPSLTQVEQLFRPTPMEPWQAVEAFATWGPRFVVLKCGREGQLVFDRDRDKRWRVPAYPTTVRDVTGAGHAFCGGFLIGLSQTGDALEAALMGNVSASLAVEGAGPFYPMKGLPGLAQARLDRLRSAWHEV